jgi:hypothetical protein
MATADRSRSNRRPTGRTLHLIDVENLAGGRAAGPKAVAPALAAYRRTIDVATDDHVVLGSGPLLAVAAGRAWPGGRLVVGRGVDGADRALLRAADPTFLAARFDRIVVASGDHAFAGLVGELRARGVAVVVVSRPGALSADLRRLTLCRPLASSGIVIRAS